jgi:hypothetical protein
MGGDDRRSETCSWGGKLYVEGIEKKFARRLFASKGTKPTGNYRDDIVSGLFICIHHLVLSWCYPVD